MNKKIGNDLTETTSNNNSCKDSSAIIDEIADLSLRNDAIILQQIAILNSKIDNLTRSLLLGGYQR